MKPPKLSYKTRFYLYVSVYSFFVLSVIYATIIGSQPFFFLSAILSAFFIMTGSRKIRLSTPFHRAGSLILGFTFLIYGILSLFASDIPRISGFFRFILISTGLFFSGSGLILVADYLFWKGNKN